MLLAVTLYQSFENLVIVGVILPLPLLAVITPVVKLTVVLADIAGIPPSILMLTKSILPF